MPIDRHFLPEHNFLLTSLHGRLDDQEVHDHVLALTEEAKEMPFLLELADCTGTQDVEGLTGVGLQLAASLEAARRAMGESKLAILVPDEETYGLARIYEAVSEKHRTDVFVFRDFGEAIAWLGLDHLRDEIDALRFRG